MEKEYGDDSIIRLGFRMNRLSMEGRNAQASGQLH